ncbi:MAG: FkbM family methyltransferase [Cyanobacteriota bacterium]|nr:FkbM family methyltransferase [Cyanobacteriota bacterium]
MRRFRQRCHPWLEGLWPGRLNGEPVGVRMATLATLVGTDRPTILEIGAHDGSHTLRFLKTFAAPTIHCFEPEPRALERWHRALEGASGVHMHPVAVGEQVGTACFYRSSGQHPGPDGKPMAQGWDYSGSLRAPRRHLELYPAVSFDRTMEVPVVSIDHWIQDQDIAKVDLLWMDVQGAEADVFRGMVKTQPNVRLIYTEYSNEELYEGQPSLDELMALLPDYEVVKRFQQDVLLKRRRDPGSDSPYPVNQGTR